jgi:carboxyl-terminal processing protease
MKKNLLIVSIIILFPFTLFAQQPLSGADSVRKVVDTLINYGKTKSIYRNKVNWQILEDSVRKQAAKAKTITEVMPAVALFYQLLGDFHGFTSYHKKIYKWRTKSIALDTLKYKSLIAKVKHTTQPESKILAKGYGYLLIPANNPTVAGADDVLAQQIQDSLSKLHLEKLKGLIIDLRANPGGDMYPMILGVGNLLGNGQLGSFIDPVTKEKEPWGIKGKAIFTGKDTVCRLKTIAPLNTQLKVVVLIGPYTASSGEATAISFIGRKNTFFIGEKTAGYTTANESFHIFDVNMFMAISVEADRNEKVYLENVTPNQEVIAGDNFENLTKDTKVVAALNWLSHH